MPPGEKAADPSHTSTKRQRVNPGMSPSSRPGGYDRLADGLELDVDGVVDVLGVAPGHRNGGRQAVGPAEGEDQAVALGQPALAERQPPQAVALEWVGPREVDRHFGPGPAQRLPHAPV